MTGEIFHDHEPIESAPTLIPDVVARLTETEHALSQIEPIPDDELGPDLIRAREEARQLIEHLSPPIIADINAIGAAKDLLKTWRD